MTKVLGPSDLYALPPLVGYPKHDLRKERLPQYSFGQRTGLKALNVGPGPAGYNVSSLVRYGVTRANKFTIASRTFVANKEKGPGPQAYEVQKRPIFTGTNAPAYSLGRPNNFQFKTCSPGPNIYLINDRIVRPIAPAYSLGIRKHIKEMPGSPGPANYGAGDISVIKPASPKFSLLSRNIFTYKMYGPGSNYYDRSYYKPGKRAPTYTFGVRHSPRTGLMIVPCDNM